MSHPIPGTTIEQSFTTYDEAITYVKNFFMQEKRPITRMEILRKRNIQRWDVKIRIPSSNILELIEEETA